MIKNIIILALILGFILIIVFLDVPIIQGVLDLRKQVKQQKDILLEKQEILAKSEELKEEYLENEENVKRINYILPSGKDEPNLIVQLEALALGGGLVIEDIEFFSGQEQVISKAQQARVREEIETEEYRILNINLKLTADYSALKKFLEAVEENIRLMDVESVKMNKQSAESQFFELEINLKTYYQ